MSIYVYLTCESHEPRLKAQDESGQHLYDLPRIRMEIANRGPLVARYRNEGPLDYFERASAYFLSQHEDCAIGIEDEYGDRYEPRDPADVGDDEEETL